MAETLPPAAVTGPTFPLEPVGFGGEIVGLAELTGVVCTSALQSTQREPVRTN
jgi:hypothetical protein